MSISEAIVSNGKGIVNPFVFFESFGRIAEDFAP